MKKLLILTLSLLYLTSFSQNNFRLNHKEYFTASIVLDPNASIKEHGLNIGAEIEYVGSVYTKLSITSFQVLKDGYLDTTGSVGLSFTSGLFENVRYYSGVRLGLIHRQATYPTAGIESGIDFMISDNAFIGVRSTYDYRSDFEFYDYPNQWRYSGFVKVGFKF